MNKVTGLSGFSLLAFVGLSVAVMADPAVRPASAMQGETTDWIKKAADWQLTQSAWDSSRDWHWGALFAGMMAAYEATKDEQYLNKSRQWAEKYTWRMGSDSRHADNQACTQAYLEMFLLDEQDPSRYAHFQYVADLMVNDPKHFYCMSSPNSSNYWWWCDALFMAPPAFVRLSHITGDPNYTNTMHWMWEEAQTCLYDTEQRLFFRDKSYFDDIIGGQEVFWARGNGWVVAGLPRVLQYLPQDDPLRSRYETLLVQMGSRLAEIQQPDGFWYANLLYPEQFGVPESSGTGFFCYGIAWAVNNGLLDAAVYGPVIEKAWNALKTAVHPDGKLGWVQPVGAGPNMSTYDGTHVYGVGAFLLAGSEMNKYFRAKDARRIDDFESYKSTDTYSPALINAWQDGTVNGSGARITLGDFGDNLMELEYDNTAAPYVSYVQRQFSPAQNWTALDAAYLSILVQGFAANSPDEMFVEIEDQTGAVAVQRLSQVDLQSNLWSELAFPLDGFSGVDLSRISALRIGVGPAGPAAPGTGAGLLRVDTIVLSPTACNIPPQGDFSGDCQVSLEDFAILAGQWLERYFQPIQPANPGTDSLEACWPLDGNYTDTTANGYDAVAGGNPVFMNPGYAGQSVYFNSASYLDVQNSTAMDLTSGATVTAWIKSSGLNHSYACVIAKGLTAWRMIRNNTDSTISFHFNAAAGGEYQANGITPVIDNRWHHLAGVYDGTQVRLYVDGKLDASAAAGPVRTSTDPVYIGSRVGKVADRSWEGHIDEVRIYDRALSESEIIHLAETTPPVENPRPTDLVTDGLIDNQDLTAFLNAWLTDNYWP